MVQGNLFDTKPKKLTQADRLLNYLKRVKRAYIWEIVRDLRIYQYNARIFDLRRKGYQIRHGQDSIGDFYEYVEEA